MRFASLLILLLSISLLSKAQKVGVVLSGGGAAGSAHVGVLKALEENNIPIDYIVGTSFGALVGGFYAAGYSPFQIEKIITSSEFRNSANGITEGEYVYFIKKSEPNSSMVSINFSLDSILGTNLPTNFVSSVSIDYGLMEFFSPACASANGNFDSLMIPFRALAANITSQKQTILRSGNLSTAIRASMTYPFYIAPVTIDANLMFDGGLYNNFPVDIMCTEFLPDYIIASNVATIGSAPTEDNLISQIRSILTKETNYEITCADGIIINTDVSNVSTFDFYESINVLEKGYTTTLQLIDSIKSQLNTTRRLDEVQYKRNKFKAKVPELIFDSIKFEGIYKSQSRYFKRSVKLSNGGVASTKLKPAYFRLTSNEKIKSAYPIASFDSTKKSFDLELKIKKEKSFKASFGGVISTKPFSTGFFQLEHQLIRSTELKTSGNIYFGSFYNSVEARLRWDIPFDLPFYVESHFTTNQFDYFNGRATFIDELNPPYIINSERYIESKISLPIFTNGKILLGYSYMWQDYEYYQGNDFSRGDTSDITSFEGSKNFVSYQRNSLNRKQYATKGSRLNISFSTYNGREETQTGSTAPSRIFLNKEREWLNLSLMYDKYFFSNSQFHLGAYVEGTYSDLPRFQNYTASLLLTPAFTPLPESRTIFQSEYRSRSFAALGLKTIYSFRDQIDFRLETYLYQPFDELVNQVNGSYLFGEEIIDHSFISTFTTVYHSKLGPLAASLNYYDNAEEELSFLIHFGYIIFNKKAFE